jgi:DNA topoisomerase-3
VELPPVEVGQPITLREAEATAHQTRPPPRYTEASMLGAMERAGRELDEAALRAAMRDGGLGTPATRAATLETLIDRAYIAREGRALVPLPAGRALIGALPVAALKSARLTGEWEARLQAMARGREDPMAFRRDIRAFVRDAVAEIMGAPAMAPIEAAAPSWRAAAGKKRSGRAAAGGSSERGRGRGAAKTGAGAARAGVSRGGTASRAAGASKTPGGRSARGSAGKAAPARGAGAAWAGGDERRIEYDDDRNDSNGFGGAGAGAGGSGGRTWSTGLSGRRGDAGRWGGGSASADSEVRSPPPSAPSRAAVRVPDASPAGSAKAPSASAPAATASTSTRVASGGAASPVGLKCPVCGDGKLMAGRAAWGCGRWREGCRFVVPFEFDGVAVPPDEAARLVGRARQTRLFARVEGRKARLVLEGEVVRWGFGA